MLTSVQRQARSWLEEKRFAKIAITVMVVATLAVMMALFAASAAGAQDYDTLDVAVDYDLNTMVGVDTSDAVARTDARKLRSERNSNRTRMRGLAREILEGGSSLSGNEADFDVWFRDVLFAEMTHTDIDSLSSLGKRRADLFDNYLRRANNQQAIDRLVRDLAFEEMKKVIAGNYHPAVQVNAMTIIGMLDTTPGVNNRRAPTPLADALPYMLDQLESDTAPDFLKATALAGIRRHAEIDGQRQNALRMPQALRNRILTAMMALMGDAPADGDPNLHAWMHRQSIRILGAMRMPGTDNAVAQALYAEMIGDADLWTKCDAARAYGMLEFASEADANAEAATVRMAELAVMAAREEIAYLESTQKSLDDLEKWRANAQSARDRFGGPGQGGPGAGGPGAGGPGAGGPGAGGPGAGGPGAGGPGEDDGYGPGGPGGGYPGAGGGGSGGNADVIEDPTDIPVYVSNLSRRRIKTFIVSIQDAVGHEGDGANISPYGLSRFGSDADVKATMKELRVGIESILTASDAGLDPDDEDADLDVVRTYSDALATAADELERVISDHSSESSDISEDPISSGG